MEAFAPRDKVRKSYEEGGRQISGGVTSTSFNHVSNLAPTAGVVVGSGRGGFSKLCSARNVLNLRSSTGGGGSLSSWDVITIGAKLRRPTEPGLSEQV